MISNSGTSTLGLYDLKRQIDAFGGVDYFRQNLAGGYLLNARVMLANGDIVKSTVNGNANDPNVDMTGWRFDDNTVDSIADLIAIKNPKNGQVVYVKSHNPDSLFGSGTYQFEKLSPKTPNGGAWIQGTGGVWVLTSDLHFENFGVTDEDEDQSDKIQACIDFALSQNIVSYGFEKSFKCIIYKEIVFRAIPQPSDWGMPADRTEIHMNGSMFVSPVNDLTYIRILRDRVEFTDTLAIDGLGTTGQIGIALGYEKTDDPMDANLRRSACFMVLNGYFPANIDIGIKSNIPRSVNGSAYGMYNHKIYNFDARHVNIAWYADKGFADDPITNKLTRTRIYGFGHVDGSCSFYMLACETLDVWGYSAEHISRDDSRLPDGKAVAWYSPYKSNPNDQYENTLNNVHGNIESSYREYINDSTFFGWDVNGINTTSQDGKVGESIPTLSRIGIGSNGTTFSNKSIDSFNFINGGFRLAVVEITSTSPAISSLPEFYNGRDFYGSVQWIPAANSYERVGSQLLTDLFNDNKQYIRTFSITTWSTWKPLTKRFGVGEPDTVIKNTTLNEFKPSNGGVQFAQVAIGGGTSGSPSSPNGEYFYGCVQWISINSSEGKQIAWGVSPNQNSQRIYTSGAWSGWVDL